MGNKPDIPSREELEAMAIECGTPPSKHVSFVGEEGFGFLPDDLTDFATRIIQWCNDAALEKAVSQFGDTVQGREVARIIRALKEE